MCKKTKNKLVALMVVGVMALPMVGYANDRPLLISENMVISEREEVKKEFIKYEGKILEVLKDQEHISIHVKSDDQEDLYGMRFHISDHVSLWNIESEELVKASDLKEGMRVTTFYNKNTPTTMSIPAQLTPSVVVIQEEESERAVYVGKFNDELINLENDLQLNIGEDTIVVNAKGEKLEANDIKGRLALVFYEIIMPSMPAQTTPSKVVVLPEPLFIEDDLEEETQVVQEMIPLRDRAIKLAYNVKWNNEDKTAEVTKANQTILVKLGEVDYSLNKSLGKFGKAPELRNGVLYVPAFVLDLMK